MKLIQYASIIFFLITTTGAFSASANDRLGECMTDECKQYFKQFKKSAKRGHPLATLTLARFYMHGYGTEKNEKVALKYFKKAAKHGFTSAQLNAGYILLTNEALKDIDASIKYLSKAAHYNDKNASFLLSMVYFDKRYNRRDLAKVDKYLAKAYQDLHKQVPEAVAYIQSEMPITAEAFPELYEEMNKTVLVKDESGRMSWPESKMEVITVTSPPIKEVLHDQLMSFRQGIKTTGTRFKGKTCLELNSCQRMEVQGTDEFYLTFLWYVWEGS